GEHRLGRWYRLPLLIVDVRDRSEWHQVMNSRGVPSCQMARQRWPLAVRPTAQIVIHPDEA
ncbi:MAG TPA: hypothetical protein VHQ67_03550, partial [Nitrospiraceae bacterium]|nr:hypothetical protein [Nitrospiraceae bacterium]